RLRMRLGIPPERLQVICTSASFADPRNAARFGGQLTGKTVDSFETVEGTLLKRTPAASGRRDDALALSNVDLSALYEDGSDSERLRCVQKFLEYRGVREPTELHSALHEALVSYAPMGRLINLSMVEARPVDTLGAAIFEGVDPALSAQAVT